MYRVFGGKIKTAEKGAGNTPPGLTDHRPLHGRRLTAVADRTWRLHGAQLPILPVTRSAVAR